MSAEVIAHLLTAIIFFALACHSLARFFQSRMERRARAESSRAFRAAFEQGAGAHTGAAQARAWDQAAEAAHAVGLTAKKRDELLSLNPYREAN